MTIAVEIRPEIESRVRTLAAAKGLSPEKFLSALIEWDIQEKKTLSSAFDETYLLQEINRGLTQEQWQRYHQLREKLQAEILSEAEHQELLQLSDYREMQNAKRLEALAHLSRLRGLSLRALMQQLELIPAHDD